MMLNVESIPSWNLAKSISSSQADGRLETFKLKVMKKGSKLKGIDLFAKRTDRT